MNQCIGKCFLFRKPKCKEICVENSVALKSITENSPVFTNVCLAVTGSPNKHGFNYPRDTMPGICYTLPCKRQLFVSCKIFNCRNCVRATWLATQFLAKLMNRACRRIQIFAKHSNYPIQQPERRGPNFRKHYKRRESAFYICQTKLKLRSLPIPIFTTIPTSSP